MPYGLTGPFCPPPTTPSSITQQKHDKEKPFLSVSIILHRMESARRFGSCSRAKSFQNRKGRSWEIRRDVPEWSLGSRIKAQGEEGHDWTRQTVATSQAGVEPNFYHVRVWLDAESEVRRGFSSIFEDIASHGLQTGFVMFPTGFWSLRLPHSWVFRSAPFALPPLLGHR